MKIRTKLVRWLVRGEFKVHECPVCGRLQSNVSDMAWHTRGCIIVNSVKHGTAAASRRTAVYSDITV